MEQSVATQKAPPERARFVVQSPAPSVGETVVVDESHQSHCASRWAAPASWMLATGGVLVLLVCIVYGQTIHHQFLHFDDDTFVYNNPNVSHGFTLSGVLWAFTDGPFHEWYPLASLSHMLDCQLFGLNPAPAHLHNLVLHAAAAVLLFLTLLRLTGQRAVPEVGQVVPASGARSGTSERREGRVSGPERNNTARVASAGPSATTLQRAVPEAAQASGVRVASAGPSATTLQRAVPEAAQASGVRVASAGPSATTLWPSAWAAAVFAVHPLHVSSVAWVSERRELLGGVCFMLTLLAYARYVERRSLKRYLAVAGCLAVGLMCKGMLVTVPCVLLLLDYWPLGRFKLTRSASEGRTGNAPRLRFGLVFWGDSQSIGLGGLIVEKLPLFALVALDCAIVLWKHIGSPVVAAVDPMPFSFRAANALVSYAAYLGQSFVPIGLSPYYPHLGTHLPLAWAWQALAVLMPITVAVAIFWRRLPFLVVGWLWFLGMLVPVLGLVGWFLQARADNYTYLSQIGLSIAVAWCGWSFYRSQQSRGARPWLTWALVGAAGTTVLLLAGVAWRQTTYWRTTESVWLRAVSCTEQSQLAHFSLGLVYEEGDRFADATGQYDQALQAPSISRYMTGQIHSHYADCLVQQHREPEALEHLKAAVSIDPAMPSHQYRLADLLTRSGMLSEATLHWREVVRLLPNWVSIRLSLADVLMSLGGPTNVDEAILHFQRSLAFHPQNARVHFRLGMALLDRGQSQAGLDHLLTAIRIQPDDVSMLGQAAWILATSPDPALRDGARAAELAGRAAELAGGDNPQVLGVLAAAQAETGQFDAAITTAQTASNLAQSQNQLDLAAAIADHLQQYQQGLAYREPMSATTRR